MLLVWDNATRWRSQRTSLNWRRQSGGPWQRETRRREPWKRNVKRRRRERENEKERWQSNKNKTWKNKTGWTTALMRAIGWPTQGSPFPGSSCPFLSGKIIFVPPRDPFNAREDWWQPLFEPTSSLSLSPEHHPIIFGSALHLSFRSSSFAFLSLIIFCIIFSVTRLLRGCFHFLNKYRDNDWSNATFLTRYLIYTSLNFQNWET